MTAQSPQSPGLLNWLQILLLGVIWGAAFMGVSVALTGYSPMTVAAGRALIGAGVLIVAGYVVGQPVTRLGGKREWLIASVIGVVNVAAPFALLGLGLQHVSSAFAGVIMGAVPILILPLVAVFSKDEGIGPRRVLGIFLGFTGVVVLIGPGIFASEGGRAETLGRLAILGSACCYAVGSVMTRNAPKMPPIPFATATVIAGALAISPLALILDGIPDEYSARATLGLLLTAIFPTALAVVLRVRVITSAGSLFMSNVSFLVPIWAVIFGITLMGEEVPPQLFVALGFVLSGIALSQWSAIRRQPQQQRKSR